jgi:hypothetical protein
MRTVEQIRGHKFLHDVKNVTIDRADLSTYLRRQMEESTPYSLQDWGNVLRALQLVDVDSDRIVPSLLSLYESQVLAFYDPQAHIFYSIRQPPKLPEEVAAMADPKMLEETVTVHELTHALQDQIFHLSQREKALMPDTDAYLAYHSLLEGEAVLVMVADMLSKNGVDLDEVMKDSSMIDMISSAAQNGELVDPSTPPYFAEMLKFPYLDGLKFVIAAYRRGGWKELDAVHADPPRTTRQILHPEEYFAKQPVPEPFVRGNDHGALAVEHLGEFHWRFLVGAENARGWVSDRAVISRDGNVRIDTEWETPEIASRFAAAYSAFLEKRGLDAKVDAAGTRVNVRYRFALE